MKRKKRRLKKKVKITLILISLILLLYGCYLLGIGKVNNDSAEIVFEVTEGSSYNSLAKQLKKQKLIKSELCYKMYLKLHKQDSLKAGKHKLRKNMNVKEIVKELEGQTVQDSSMITFKEGINFETLISLITSNTNITKDDILDKISDTAYLDKLIQKYWFLTDDIKNKSIYYSLEGYLFPDTYQFHKDGTIEDILEAMLDNMSKKLEPYRNSIQNSKYSIHEIMTMASIVELEASNSDDRAGVAGVFYNRLESGWSLGSDVTTYYGLKLALK